MVMTHWSLFLPSLQAMMKNFSSLDHDDILEILGGWCMNFLHVSGIWVLNFPTLFQFYPHERPVVCQLHCHCIKVVIFMKFLFF